MAPVSIRVVCACGREWWEDEPRRCSCAADQQREDFYLWGSAIRYPTWQAAMAALADDGDPDGQVEGGRHNG